MTQKTSHYKKTLFQAVKIPESKTPRLFYAAGPGDIVTTFSCWQKGIDDPHQIAVTYSSQFFDLCKHLGVHGTAISSCQRQDHIETAQFIVENLSKGPSRSGIAYHLQQINYVRTIVKKAKATKTDILIIADSTGHFFPLPWFAPHTMHIVLSLHCTLWPKSKQNSFNRKIISKLNRTIFSNKAAGILCLSDDIRRQLTEVTGGNNAPIQPFIPYYRRELFSSIPPPPKKNPFNLLFAGRMETSKGIYDLLEVALMLKRRKNNHIVLHLCGNGPEEENLKNAVHKNGVESIMQLHGYCNQPDMLKYIGMSHAFIVPTRSSFEEGFNKVVAEAILAGRPVIATSVCPALNYVRNAVLEIPPDDALACLNAAIDLSSLPELYRTKQQGCLALQEQFYDASNSWKAALERIIRDLQYG